MVELLNYRKDGSQFWNSLHIGPILSGESYVRYFFGSQWDVSDLKQARESNANARIMNRELSHRLLNTYSVISAIVRISGHHENAGTFAEKVVSRIEALARTYEATFNLDTTAKPSFATIVKSIASAYDPMHTDSISYFGPDLDLDPATLSVLGLVLHELCVNAIKYGALSVEGGRVDVNWVQQLTDAKGSQIKLVWSEHGGPVITAPPAHKGSGTRLLVDMLRVANGEIDFEWPSTGLVASITLNVSTSQVG